MLKVTLITGSLFCFLLCVLAVMQIRRLLRPVGEAFTKQRQFVWDASHELKTPLAVISANAQVLEHELVENEYLGYIVNETRSMNTLVQNLLTLARMDSSGQKPSFERFDLGCTLLAPFRYISAETDRAGMMIIWLTAQALSAVRSLQRTASLSALSVLSA